MRNLFSQLKLKTFAGFIGAALLSANALAFDEIYIFGDSLSDTGNINVIIPQAPLRFSNGPVAVDILTAQYGLDAVPSLLGGNNFAFGGARAIGSETEFDTNLPIQVNSYLQASGNMADPNALYVLIIGGNDLFFAESIRAQTIAEDSGPVRQDLRKQAEAYVSQAVTSIENQLLKLVAAGATNILVGNAPDVAQTPSSLMRAAAAEAAADDHQEAKRASKYGKYISKLTSQFNEELAAAVARVEVAANIEIVEWDLASFLSNQIEDADVLGFDNTTSACIEDFSNLPACEGYIFFDTVHPTTAVHTAAGIQVFQLLN
ncbi:MAG: hypothetical protein C9356_10875 [Oleiphilus sp.]|nr:MAG: hypothetical protein C9356_10875 [Oleiphilus sp.]